MLINCRRGKSKQCARISEKVNSPYFNELDLSKYNTIDDNNKSTASNTPARQEIEIQTDFENEGLIFNNLYWGTKKQITTKIPVVDVKVKRRGRILRLSQTNLTSECNKALKNSKVPIFQFILSKNIKRFEKNETAKSKILPSDKPKNQRNIKTQSFRKMNFSSILQLSGTGVTTIEKNGLKKAKTKSTFFREIYAKIAKKVKCEVVVERKGKHIRSFSYGVYGHS